MKELKRYFSYLGKYKVRYWSVFLMTLLTSALLTLLYPYMNKLIFNALEYGDFALFQRAAVLCVSLVVLNCLAPYRRYFQIKIVRDVVFDIKIRLFEKLTRMDMNYFEKHHSGEALKILNWDANSLKDSYFSHVFWVAGRLVNGITSLIAMLVYSPVLAVVSVSFSLLTVFISVKINRQIKKMDKAIQNRVSRLTTWLSDILCGFAELKMYPGASIVCDNFHNENQQILKEQNRRANRTTGLEVAAFLLGILGSFGTVGVGVYLVSCGQLDYGTVMAIVSLQLNVSFLVQSFGSALTTLSASLVKAGRVFDFLEMDGEETNSEKVYTKEVYIKEVYIKEIHSQYTRECRCECPKGTFIKSKDRSIPIAIHNLTFSYDGQCNILADFSLHLTSGEKLLLIGESGCGKSTLLKLLVGFCKEDSGAIQLYGRNLQEYSLSQLRHLITYIPQRSYLFEGTIGENIAMGAGGQQVNTAEIAAAAKMAYADEFIRTLPDGYDTHLEAGGKNLSVGQRQRIAIARAFLRDAPILLMDEPSSALDAHSEQMIQQSMRELMKDKTVILVTHRENSFEGFDRRVKLARAEKV